MRKCKKKNKKSMTLSMIDVKQEILPNESSIFFLITKNK